MNIGLRLTQRKDDFADVHPPGFRGWAVNRRRKREGHKSMCVNTRGGLATARSYLAAVAIGLGMTLTAGAATAQTQQIQIADGQVSKLIVAPGHTVTIETDQPFANIVIGNTDILDVFPLTEMSMYVQAKTSGFTNVTLYNEDQKLLEVIDVRVRLDYAELQDAIDRAVPSARVDVNNINNRIRLSGTVKDNVDLRRVLQIAEQYSTQPVINAIRVTTPQQVQLDVRILEVSRNSGRQLGVNLLATDRTSGDVDFRSGSTPDATPFGTAVGRLLSISGTDVDIVINALEAKGLARRLANPTLVTTSGTDANFVVGGEIPIRSVVRSENGTITGEQTDYREYGVRLNFRPVVLDNNLINLRIAPEVSDIDTSTTDLAGDVSFISRKAETTVSLRDGQSFAIAGLLQASNERNVEQVPWLGQVPVLGTLFRSTAFQKRETDLVILVTPHLVRPASPGQPLRSPLDDTRSSTDTELFLLGMMEVDRQTLRGFADGEGIVGPYGHMIDLEFEDGVIKKK